MKKLVLLMTVAAIGAQVFAADRGYAPRNYGGERNGYAEREPQEQDFRAERRSPQDQQRFVMAELQQKARARELQQEQLRQRQEEQEELRAEQQRNVMAQLRQNPRFRAARDAEVQESRYATREEEQDPRYAASARRSPAELERERAIQEEEMRAEDELRAMRADAQRRRILADRARQAEEERYGDDNYNPRAAKRRVFANEEFLEEKAPEKKEEKASTIDQVKKYATAENLNMAKETVNTLKGVLGGFGLFGG